MFDMFFCKQLGNFSQHSDFSFQSFFSSVHSLMSRAWVKKKLSAFSAFFANFRHGSKIFSLLRAVFVCFSFFLSFLHPLFLPASRSKFVFSLFFLVTKLSYGFRNSSRQKTLSPNSFPCCLRSLSQKILIQATTKHISNKEVKEMM